MSAKEILPSMVRLKLAESGSLIERIILSSSNSLRRHMELLEGETLPGPIPKFVTRKNPSLDNYFADLLLRSCYEAVEYLPSYDEHVMYGSPDELPSRLNPRLVGAILIGIGGRSSNPDFLKVYDEHSFHGTRSAPSASQVVFAEHLDRHSARPGVQAVGLLLNEINSIDSEGGASRGHLYNILKSLNVAEFVHPGFVFEPLHPQWKRAVVGACLSSVCVAIDDFQNYDLEQATRDLETEWDTYLAKIEKRIKYGFPDKIIPAAAREIRQSILQPREPRIVGVPGYLTLKRILFAFRHSWHPSVAAYLLEFLFEAMRQSQQSFEEVKNADVPLRWVHGDYAYVYYRQESKDRLPHRGLLARMNSQAIKGVLVIFNPAHENIAIFGSRHLPKTIWRSFVESLVMREGDSVWYVPTAADGTYANFMLNGTESYRGVPKTALSADGLFDAFSASVAGKAATAGQQLND
jgi:hypothetical protein